MITNKTEAVPYRSNWLPSITLLSRVKFYVTWWNIFFDCSYTSCSA